MRPHLLVALLVLPAVLGCLGTGDETDRTPPVETDRFHPKWYELALASGNGHDHEDVEAHANLTTPNVQVLGHDPLVTDLDGTAPGGSSCGDARPGGNKTLGAQKIADSSGVVVTDLTDPTNPTKVGELVLTATHIYDVAIVPTGQHMALITSQPKQGPLPTGTPGLGTWSSPCTGTTTPVSLDAGVQDPVPRPTSLLLVDLSDPSSPAIVDQRPISGLGHGIFSTTVDGEVWVLGITEGIAQGSRHFHLYQLTDGPTGDVLEPLSVHVAQPNPDHADAIVGHSDGWIKTHPVTGETTGFFAAGSYVELVDYSDPRRPQRLGTWTDIRGELPADHNLHSVHALDTAWNGSHYTVVGPELGGPPENGAPSGTVWVLDTTDPTQPREVAAWTLPTEVEWSGSLQYSTHYLTVVDRTLFVSMYHGGVWAIDLANVAQGTPEDPALLPSIGVFVPVDPQAPKPQGYAYGWTPNLEEVLHVGNGTLVTFDSNSGVWTFTFDATDPAPAPEPWPLEPLP